jgi:hypothetical protein
MARNKRQELRAEILRMEELLRERERALPAHSVRPQHIQEIEALEERIAELERQLSEMSEEGRGLPGG